MRRWSWLLAVVLAGCDYAVQEPMRLSFAPMAGETAAYAKLNVQVFDSVGAKVFSKVKTQNAGDSGFGSLALDIPDGTYTVVAVGHSNPSAAIIKSPQMVQFTAHDGRKITDTFCACAPIRVGVDKSSQSVQMDRLTAMFRLSLATEPLTADVAQFRFDYTGGSAAFSPSTLQGCTKSTQSEVRPWSGFGSYEVFTFPYLSDSCRIRMSVSALDASGQVIRHRVFESVPMIRNRITEYRGRFFADDDDPWAVVTFSFYADPTWQGTDIVGF